VATKPAAAKAEPAQAANGAAATAADGTVPTGEVTPKTAAKAAPAVAKAPAGSRED
jgi:hypothetical protein